MNIIRNPFLTWVFLTGLTVTGFFWAHYAGLVTLILATDFTRITLAIFIIAAVLILLIGYVAYKMQFDMSPTSPTSVFQILDTVSRLSARLPQLGFIGTVIGLANLLQTSTMGITTADSALVTELMHHIGTTSGAALYPTLTGLISYLIIQGFLDVFHYIFEGKGYAS